MVSSSKLMRQMAQLAKDCCGKCTEPTVQAMPKKMAIPSSLEIVDHIKQHGFAHMKCEFYVKPHEDFNLLEELQKSYKGLPRDMSSLGNRFRSIAQLRYSPMKDDFDPIDTNQYWQRPSTNPIDGGKVREFGKIADSFLKNNLMASVIQKDIEMAKQLTHLIKFDESLKMIIHQIRYSPKYGRPSYSSPAWLHKDDEPLAFIHLINITPNIVGADTVISNDKDNIEAVFCLTDPLDTFVVTDEPYHAVTPMGCSDHEEAFRDLVYVDFINRE